ncbi:MAG: hypothetical protein ACRCYU_03850 [Nocardioides sp.]
MNTQRDEGTSDRTGAHRPLGEFETNLLAELQLFVADRSLAETELAEGSTPGPDAARKPRGVRRIGLVAAASAVVAVASLASLQWGSSPAFAVAKAADGDIVVTIHRLEDANELEAALAEKGVTARVEYDADPDDAIRLPGDGSGNSSLAIAGSAEGDDADEVLPPDFADGCDFGQTGVDFGRSGTDYRFTLQADSILKSKVLQVSVRSDETWLVAYDSAQQGDACAVAGLTPSSD